MTSEEFKAACEDMCQCGCTIFVPYTGYLLVDECTELKVYDGIMSFGRGPDCYNCDCKVKCERYAQR